MDAPSQAVLSWGPRWDLPGSPEVALRWGQTPLHGKVPQGAWSEKVEGAGVCVSL